MGGVIDSVFGSDTKTTQQPFESNPWEPQQKFLKDAFSRGQGALDKGLSELQSIGDFTADLNPGQKDAIALMQKLGMQNSSDVSNAAMQAGLGGVQNVQQAANNSQAVFDRTSTDRTQDIIGNAQQFADNPALQGVIDSSISDVRQGFDRDVASINSSASQTGNINSTRAGALEARALDDAMDRSADISSTLRANAFNSGLDRAAALDSAQTSNMLNANQQLGQTGQASLNTALQGLQAGSQGASDAFNASKIFQDQQQAEIQGKRQMSQAELDLINQYMGIIGRNFGKEGFNTQVSESPSPFQQITGAASSIAGLF